MTDVVTLNTKIHERFGALIQGDEIALNELTLTVARENLLEVCFALRDEPVFDFKMLIDICGVDYLHYGIDEWETDSATSRGFERGRDTRGLSRPLPADKPRFATVYHLLSLNQNHRVRLKVLLAETDLVVNSVVEVWPAANWFEREAFDLFGIVFKSHPDLRRILTDYGFVGHPFRKDFPLIGNMEVRYDAKLRRVIYEPVSIKPRILEPKVIRRDNRYEIED